MKQNTEKTLSELWKQDKCSHIFNLIFIKVLNARVGEKYGMTLMLNKFSEINNSNVFKIYFYLGRYFFREPSGRY